MNNPKKVLNEDNFISWAKQQNKETQELIFKNINKRPHPVLKDVWICLECGKTYSRSIRECLFNGCKLNA